MLDYFHMREIIIIAHDMRSIHNVGSLLRTAEGFGASKVYLTGYTPYPIKSGDDRLPHLARKIDAQISKTALGAEHGQPWEQVESIKSLLNSLKERGFTVAGLEQNNKSIALPEFTPPEKIAVLLGSEVEGLAQELIRLCDVLLEIPMYGQKESFNVVQAAAICLYALREA
jgi:23S rRNA (guanosine2251-2'-O)-methyltransferase